MAVSSKLIHLSASPPKSYPIKELYTHQHYSNEANA